VTKAEKEIIKQAKTWWKSKRPVEWNEYQHWCNPCINTHMKEQVLALAVSKLLSQKYKNKH